MEKLIRILSLTRKHVTLLIVIAILILASSTIVSYLNTRDLIDTEKSIAESYKTIYNMEKLLSTFIDAETGRRGYFITDDIDFLYSYKNASNTVDTLYSKIKFTTTGNAVQQSNLDTLTLLVRERFSLFEQSIKLQELKGSSMRIHRPLFEKGNDVQYNIRRIVENMKAEEKRVISKKQDIAMKSSDFSVYGMIGGATFSIFLLIMSFALLMKISSLKNENTTGHRMSRDELETLVRDRTSEISQINNKLNQKISEIERLKAVTGFKEHNYMSIFELSHDATIIFRPESEIVLDVNSKACDIYNIKRAEFIGISFKYLSKNVPQGEKEIQETLRKGSYQFESVHYKKDGTEMLMHVNATVINYDNEKAILAMISEITDKVFQVV